MKKKKTDKDYRKEDQLYSDHNRKNVQNMRKKRGEKRFENALRSNNAEVLRDMEYY